MYACSWDKIFIYGSKSWPRWKIFACDNSQTRIDKALKDKSRHRLNNIEWHLLDASKDKYPLHKKFY